MKNAIKAIVSGIALVTCLAAAPGFSATITWDTTQGTGTWTTGSQWIGATAPVSGDSADLANGSGTYDVQFNTSFTIENGQSITDTGSGLNPELALLSGSSLTLATGGTMDIEFMRPRFNNTLARDFIIEPGATLTTQAYGLGATRADITFIADSAGVTVWNSAGQFQMGADNLVVDLTNYDFSNGNTLTLVNYGGSTDGQEFTSVSVLGAKAFTIDYGDGTNDSITLTVIPEPSTLVLFGLGVAVLCLSGRRRRKR